LCSLLFYFFWCRYGEEEDDEEGEEGAEKAKGKRGNLRPAILEDEALAGQGMGAALKVSRYSLMPTSHWLQGKCTVRFL
jgi:hypothetical protein